MHSKVRRDIEPEGDGHGIARAVHNKETRPFDPQILYGRDLVLDWALLGLRIKECSNTPGRAPTPTEKKHYVIRSVELTHEQVADLVADYRAAQ